ncbi:MAG TPA: aldo/keto reductase [Steroidobacteraceae bacterium]|nr:aldo/keto reductase [Steroidobacteraceae bacterium]
MKLTQLPAGESVPILGQGTWQLGENPRKKQAEIAALRLGLDLGMTLMDTAEMYGDGATEKLVAEAIAGRRDEVFLVSKVLPHHATVRGTIAACEASLRRLNTDVIDLYLLHWRGSVALSETLEAFTALVKAGKIRYWGVSNFDDADMEELFALNGGEEVATNQVLYNLTRRGIERDLLPLCRTHRIPIMAYSPIEQGRVLGRAELRRIADRHGVTPVQVALAWVLRAENIIAIPRSGNPDHVRENRAALDIQLTSADIGELDLAFAAPTGKRPLEMI